MFKLLKIENARMNVPEPEFLDAKAGEEIAIGEALVLSGGVLTKCGATTRPAYIAMGVKPAGDVNRALPVCRVESNQVWEAPISAAPGELKVGDKITIAADALQVTATTASGVASIVSLNGAAAEGDAVIVRF